MFFNSHILQIYIEDYSRIHFNIFAVFISYVIC